MAEETKDIKKVKNNTNNTKKDTEFNSVSAFICIIVVVIFIASIGSALEATRLDKMHQEAVCKAVYIDKSTRDYFNCVEKPAFRDILKDIK